MKKLFTLIALAMSFMGGYAQSYEWNFSDSKWLNGAADKYDYTASTTIDGLTINIADAGKKMTIDGNTKTVDGVKYTSRLKLSGTGSISDVNKLGRVLSFDVEGDCSIYLVFAHGSKSGDDRPLVVSALVNGKVSEIQKNNVAANLTTSATVNYNGGATKILVYSGNSGINVYDIKVSSTLTTAASSFSTYAASYPVDYKSLGLTAYAIGLDETAKKVTYTEIDGIVPANTPVLVKGEASKTYSLTKAEGDAAEVTTSLLVSDGKVVTEGDLYYAFSTVDGKSGFKRIANGITIPAKKGYLKLASASAKSFFSFDDETTGIKGIENGTVAEENAPLYNLAGQRVSKDYKGVVVKNGKKFFNK